MVISIEETNSNPWQQAAQSMMSAGIGSLSGNVMDPPQNLNIDPEASKWNYNKAQVNMNEPIARELLRESYRTDQEQGKQAWFQDAIPTYDPKTWIVNSFNRGQPIMNTGIPANNQGYKVMNAGITNPNLGGAKVWNAGGPIEWLQNLDLFGWEDKQKENKQLQNQLNEIYQQQDKIRMSPYFFDPGPWNEFDPSEKEKKYYNMMDMDEGGTEWPPSEEYLSGTTELAQSQWKKPENMEKTIQSLKLRPEFQDWTDEAIKNWLYNTARANRGGIIGLI